MQLPINLRMMFRELEIGEVSENNQITIIDKDRLCYLVKSQSRGAEGLRTISKVLLNEFVAYMQKHPDKTAFEIRDELKGTTQTDRFEYGYCVSLYVMAQMVLSKKTIQHHAPYQAIYYGSPGTGKSHQVNQSIKGESVIRTTFHPDSDYATFIGAYKPVMKRHSTELLSTQELTKRLKEMKQGESGYIPHKFAAIYWKSLELISAQEIKEILSACDYEETYYQEINKGIAIGKRLMADKDEQISYEFVPQAFLRAYVKAWKFYLSAKSEADIKKQFLVVEEINRGNCAQIFGDIFQLLDRNKYGFSDYPIAADSDIRKYLKNAFKGLDIRKERCNAVNSYYDQEEIITSVLSGTCLLLPGNLHIIGTMNTSDQSLFPMDSAFKRRWAWKYVPINYSDEVESYNYIITIGDKEYRWVDFLQKVNKQIKDLTSSEDKKMGNFFIKSNIGSDEFKDKVMFYVWEEVCKEEYRARSFFKRADGTEFSFSELYEADGTKILQEFIEGLGVTPLNKEAKTDEQGTDNEE